MTNEELDEARVEEAYGRWRMLPAVVNRETVPLIVARLAREGWTPPKTVDPDLLAARGWAKTTDMGSPALYDDGSYDTEPEIIGFLAGCTRGREGVKGLVEAVNKAVRVLTDTAESLPTRLLDTCDILLDALASAKRGG